MSGSLQQPYRRYQALVVPGETVDRLCWNNFIGCNGGWKQPWHTVMVGDGTRILNKIARFHNRLSPARNKLLICTQQRVCTYLMKNRAMIGEPVESRQRSRSAEIPGMQFVGRTGRFHGALMFPKQFDVPLDSFEVTEQIQKHEACHGTGCTPKIVVAPGAG